MSKNPFPNDFRLVLRGLQKVLSTNIAQQKACCETVIKNSSITPVIKDIPNFTKQILPLDGSNILERASMFPKGLQTFASLTLSKGIKDVDNYFAKEAKTGSRESLGNINEDEEILVIIEEDLEGVYIRSLGVELLQQNEDGKAFVKQYDTSFNKPINHLTNAEPYEYDHISEKIRIPKSKNEKLIDNPDIQKIVQDIYPSPKVEINQSQFNLGQAKSTQKEVPSPRNVKPLSRGKPESKLGASSKERKVPASRVSRLVSYGGLAAGLGIGALTEITKRSLGLSNPNNNSSLLESSPFLTESNAERIVDTLCRVRGAALKIGQILSIQDNSMINPQLQKVFERVRHAADFMPSWQMEKMMETEFGLDWRSKFSEFESRPFAAASIGQVHLGKLHDGRPVAVKIQYPGVAKGIESDIDNLMAVLGVWSILPEGIFADNIIEVAKRELSWEVDYIREQDCAKRFKKLLEPYPDYYVPEVIDELTTRQVYTTELIEGVAVDKCENLDQETRNRISFLMLDLFFRELFQFRFMQTDPNWSNFLYNMETKQIGLLDFGASREYGKEFVDNYLMILKGAAMDDVKLVLQYSRDIGFLTGYESKVMEKAHVDTVMMLGEAFRIGDKPYDFGTQRITQRIQELVPVMVRERLCPPPEEIYSLHRKLSGIFLLCARLKGKVKCRPIFERILSENNIDES